RILKLLGVMMLNGMKIECTGIKFWYLRKKPVEKFVNENELSDLKVLPARLHNNQCQFTPDQHWSAEPVSVTEDPNWHR
ncbi:hypothetical protein KI387_027083, partial [Taxus chinensis]